MTSTARIASISATPSDLIAAYDAAVLAVCSASTLRRWARQGRLREFSHPDRTCRFYSRAEVEKFRPRLNAPRRPAKVPRRRSVGRR